jgi:hypothetical protein
MSAMLCRRLASLSSADGSNFRARNVLRLDREPTALPQFVYPSGVGQSGRTERLDTVTPLPIGRPCRRS